MDTKYWSVGHKSFWLITVLLVLLTACNNTKLNLPVMEDIATATIREYCNGTPVSREITLSKDSIGLLNYFIKLRDYGKYKQYRKTIKKSVSDVPTVEKSFRIRLELVSGEVRTFYIYATGNKEYIEEPHIGIYKYLYTINSLYRSLTRESSLGGHAYLYISLSDAFFGENYSILQEYNGAAKAIFMEFKSGGDDTNDNPLSWPSRYIPEARVAERAEDVRYIVAYYDKATYSGYWYVPSTGKRLGNSYDHTYDLIIHDLIKKETTSMGNISFGDASSVLEKYFSNAE